MAEGEKTLANLLRDVMGATGANLQLAKVWMAWFYIRAQIANTTAKLTVWITGQVVATR